MKKVKMMYLKRCPHCRRAFHMLEELKEQNKAYQNVEIEYIEEEEESEKTEGYDYYYVPTFFVGETKIHEGVPTLEKVEMVLKEALR